MESKKPQIYLTNKNSHNKFMLHTIQIYSIFYYITYSIGL